MENNIENKKKYSWGIEENIKLLEILSNPVASWS